MPHKQRLSKVLSFFRGGDGFNGKLEFFERALRETLYQFKSVVALKISFYMAIFTG